MVVKKDCKCEQPIRYVVEQAYLGKITTINLCCIANKLQELYPEETFITVENRPEGKEDWDKNEEKKFEARQEEINRIVKQNKEIQKRITEIKERNAKIKAGELEGEIEEVPTLLEVPKPYIKKEMPTWLKRRIEKIKR